MAADSSNAAYSAAQRMLDTFASAGAEAFDLTLTTLGERKVRFRPRRSMGQLRHTLPDQLAEAERLQYSVIIRPTSRRVDFIQLDDLDDATLERVGPLALLIVKTSAKGNQAWLAVDTPHDTEFTRRVRKATGADLMASGAVRIAGSVNFKAKYAPNFPRVEMTYSNPGRICTRPELEALGLVAPPEVFTPPPVRVSHRGASGPWPRYEDTLAGARLKADGSPDRSGVDFVWAKTAYRWGFSIEEIAARLPEVSEKARDVARHNPGYALVTAKNAAAAEERNRGRALP